MTCVDGGEKIFTLKFVQHWKVLRKWYVAFIEDIGHFCWSVLFIIKILIITWKCLHFQNQKARIVSFSMKYIMSEHFTILQQISVRNYQALPCKHSQNASCTNTATFCARNRYQFHIFYVSRQLFKYNCIILYIFIF